jgi:hypothetical protein
VTAAERAQGYRRLYLGLMRWLHMGDYEALRRWPVLLAVEAIEQMQEEARVAVEGTADESVEYFDGE